MHHLSEKGAVSVFLDLQSSAEAHNLDDEHSQWSVFAESWDTWG